MRNFAFLLLVLIAEQTMLIETLTQRRHRQQTFQECSTTFFITLKYIYFKFYLIINCSSPSSMTPVGWSLMLVLVSALATARLPCRNLLWVAS